MHFIVIQFQLTRTLEHRALLAYNSNTCEQNLARNVHIIVSQIYNLPQMPSFTRDETTSLGLYPLFGQLKLPFGQADVPTTPSHKSIIGSTTQAKVTRNPAIWKECKYLNIFVWPTRFITAVFAVAIVVVHPCKWDCVTAIKTSKIFPGYVQTSLYKNNEFIVRFSSER